MSIVTQNRPVVVIGVDTHKDAHVAVGLDTVGKRYGELIFPANTKGYRSLLVWAQGLGEIQSFGIEGTSSYGAGLARFLHKEGFCLFEVNRPDRAARRSLGKTDSVDAQAAAAAVLSGRLGAQPKHTDDRVEMIRVLKVAVQGALKARTQAITALRSVLVTAPEALRCSLEPLEKQTLVKTCASLRPGVLNDPSAATKMTLRCLAKRYLMLCREIDETNQAIEELVAQSAPTTLSLFGVGPSTAATLVVAAGENVERLKSEAAFASLCGVSPISASSGKTVRHRLNRGGNRAANAALHVIVLCRMAHDQRTKDYVIKRTAQGKSKRETMRCLKRYVAREVYRCLLVDREHRMAQNSLQKAS